MDTDALKWSFIMIGVIAIAGALSEFGSSNADKQLLKLQAECVQRGFAEWDENDKFKFKDKEDGKSESN